MDPNAELPADRRVAAGLRPRPPRRLPHRRRLPRRPTTDAAHGSVPDGIRTIHDRPIDNARPDHSPCHGVFGAIFFTSAPVCCFVFYRRFRTDDHWRPFPGWTLGAGILLILGIATLRVSQQPGSGLFEFKGPVQRVLLIIMTWIFAFAFRLRHPRTGRNQGQKALP